MSVKTRGLIYDHDGTLIDSIDLVAEATNAVLRSIGARIASREEIKRGMLLPTDERLGHHALCDDPARMADLAALYYTEAWRIGALAARPYQGVPALLAAVHALGPRQGMLSNNQGRFIRAIMAAHGFDFWVNPILGEEDVPAPKPAAEGLLQIAREWNLAPNEILVVGDSAADAGAAQAAGCSSVGVTWGAHPRDVLVKAGFDRLIDQPEELPALLLS